MAGRCCFVVVVGLCRGLIWVIFGLVGVAWESEVVATVGTDGTGLVLGVGVDCNGNQTDG